jgi:hypothetical protein
MSVYPKPAPQSPPATPQPFEWLMPPQAGFGMLRIGTTTYAVREVEYDEPNGRQRMLVRLAKMDGTVYQLTPDADDLMQCDCADSVFRQRRCKHSLAIVDAYADLNREQRLADFIAGPDDPVANLTSAGWEAGLPATVSAATAQVDADSAALMKCPTCRKRGLTFTPMRRGTAYIGIAQCVRCGFAEQV